MKTVTVVGLGYVGLPLACLLAKHRYDVFGYDINKEIVESTNIGKSHIKDDYLEKEVSSLKGKIKATTNPKDALSHSSIIVVCVPTPVDENHLPNLKPLESACKTIAKYLKKDDLVIIESTIAPGTCDEVVMPILETPGLKVNKDFYVVHCPERIDPGNKKYHLEDLPRVIGASNEKGLELASDFYTSIIKANILKDINIAFVNELAKSFDKLGIDITEVIKGASTKPFAFMPHWPGCGVGGHCISVDPYYLIDKAHKKGFEHEFLKLARSINNSMPGYTISRAEEALSKIGKKITDVKISVLGVAYKKNVDDPRESPALELIHELKELACKFNVFDPYLPKYSTVSSLQEALDAECIIICTDHDLFTQIMPKQLKCIKVLIDGRNCMDKKQLENSGIIYRGIGR